jgi:hypothetical protein
MKLAAMLAGYLLLCCIPLLLRESILGAFTSIRANAPSAAANVGSVFFYTLFEWFAGLLGGVLLIKCVFYHRRSAQRHRRPRRVAQILINF